MASEQFQIHEVVQTATRFAARHIEPVAMDADHGDPCFPEDVFHRGIEAGFDRFILPEDAGGYGFQMVDLCTLIRTLAQTCAGHAMVFGVHAASIRSLFDAGGAHCAERIERVISSGRPIGVCVPDPLSYSDFESSLIVSPGDDEEFQRGGGSAWTINAHPSGWFLAFAKTSREIPVALLFQSSQETGGPGEPEFTLGLRSMPVAELTPSRDGVSRSDIIAEGEEALWFYKSLLCNLSVVTAAAACGLMEKAFKKALRYAKERYQGGKNIIDHSHLRGILGEMSSGVTASVGSVFHTASQPFDTIAAMGTKVFVTEQGVKICTHAVQILGGYGYMRDYGLEKAMRDAAVLALLPISNARAELLITALEKEALS